MFSLKYHFVFIGFIETINLRNVKGSNLNYSCNDVIWSTLDPIMLATAATNGAIIIWNIAGTGGQKQKYIDTILNEHRRIVNKINFHPTMPKCLISGSQDGSMRLFDLRIPGEPLVSQMMFSQTESVRDVQWNIHGDSQVAAVSENGQVQLWDIRKCDRAEVKWSAHPDHIYTCEWHPEEKNTLATAGRDKCIKVWDTSSFRNSAQPEQRNTIYAMDAISKLHWRPQKPHQISSISLMSDFAIHVWDLRRPYVPYSSFTEHTDIPTSFLWRGDPYTILSAGKDNMLYQHAFADAKRPALHRNPVGMCFNVKGDLLYAFRDGRTQEILPHNKQHAFHPNQGVFSTSKLSPSSAPKLEKLADNFQTLAPLTQKSLQTYYERVRNNSSELFRNNSSYMIQINSFVEPAPNGTVETDREDSTNDSFYQDEDDDTHFLTNQHYIKYIAQHYRYSGMSFTNLCDHNTKTASSLGRCQLATAWQVLKSIYLTNEELVIDLFANESGVSNDSTKENNDYTDKIIPNKDLNQSKNLNDTSISLNSAILKKNDVITTEDHNGSPSQEKLKDTKNTQEVQRRISVEPVSSKRQSRGRKISNKALSINDSMNDTEDSSDDCDVEYNDTLTNIASGHMLSGSVGRGLIGGHQDGDFFGDMENAILYKFDNLNPNNFAVKSEPDFSNLPTEAFEYRRELPNESLENTQTWQRQHTSSDSNLIQNIEGKDDQPLLQTTVTVVNSGVNTLSVDLDVIDQIDAEAEIWNPDHILLENLEYYSDLNDVQTAVSMYLVALPRMKNQRLVNSHIVHHWFSCYIDQLQQLELYPEANQIMSLCPLSTVNSQTTRSTFIRTLCGNCGKLIETNRITSSSRANFGRCKKCQSMANECAVCHKPVQGLYVWCQGCGHGGHLEHISEWLEENKKCPFGCGHRCEYD